MVMSELDEIIYQFNPVKFSIDFLEKIPDPWQEQVMLSGSKRILLNCSRQSGKSTTSSIIALHKALFEPGSLILLISPSLRQSSELFKKVQVFYRMVPDQPKLPEDNKLSMTLHNGSRIISLPSSEANIRGFSSVALVIEDEASRVDDSLYRAVRPMLAISDGTFMLMSTPWGKRGHFFEEWTGPNEWERVEIPATSCPRITPEFLEEERRSLGDWWYLQEYMCQFGDTTDSLFSYDDIQAAVTDEVDAMNIDTPEVWTPPEEEESDIEVFEVD